MPLSNREALSITAKQILPFVVIAVYGVANAYLMLWVGFGGGKPLVDLLGSYWAAFAVYGVLCAFLVFLPLMKTTVLVRNCARYAIFAPWALLLIVLVPQYGDDPLGVLQIFFAAALVWFSSIPGEKFVRWMRRDARQP